MSNKFLHKLFYIVIWCMIIPIMVNAQSIILQGNDIFHVAAGETISSVGGIKVIGTSSAGKLSFANGTETSSAAPNSKRVLVTNPNAIYELRNVSTNQTASFFLDVAVSTSTAAADLSIKNKNTSANYQTTISQIAHPTYNDIPLEWKITKVGANATDENDLTFTWGAGLESTTITNKRLYIYNDAQANWVMLANANTTVNESQKTLSYTGFVGSLNGARFMIAAASSNADLSALTISSGTLSPAFASGTTSYTASVSNAISSIMVTPTRAEANASITVNGTAVSSGMASGAIALNVGSNAITTIVTAQDGTSTKTYTITVTRAASSNADLSALSISSGTLSPTFSSSTTSYTATAPYTQSAITVTPTVADAMASVKVNGTLVTSGQASAAISLNEGANILTTLVTAQDGTTKTYTTTVTRAAFSSLGGITIVASGGATENSGWSYANGTLAPTSNTAVSVNASDVVAKMALANLTIAGSSVTMGNSVNVTSSNNKNLTLKSAGTIVVNSASKISTQGGSVILWADADGNGAGDIFFTSGTAASILTNGGHLWLGGGSGSETWNGLTVGNGFAVGDAARTVLSGIFYNGITIDATNINTVGGHIKMRGKGKAGDLTLNTQVYSGGMYLLGAGSMNSGGGNIDIEAVAQVGAGQHYGFYNFGPYTFTPGTGNLTITGDASASSSGNYNLSGSGIFMWTNALPIVSGGNITLIGKKSSNSNTFGVDIRTSISTTSGNISVTGDVINLVSGLTATNNNITLTATTGISQSAAITANALILEGAANATLTNANNSINTISGGTSTSRIGALNFANSKILTVGSSGIFSTGLIELATSGGGDITLTGGVNSNLLTGDAVKLYADKGVSAGGTSGGNIKITGSGALAIASGARALLYSGTETLSTGLTAAVGGTANTRKNVAASTTISSISPALSASGTYALYREAATLPVLLVNYEAKSKVDGSVYLNWQTASEQHNSYFEILRSTDGKNFTSIAKVNGSGNSSEAIRYGYVDASPSIGINYYLLVQYDQDGTRKELGLRSVKVLSGVQEVYIYPNPTKGDLNLEFEANTYQRVELIDLAGRILISKMIAKQDSKVSFDMSEIANGIYTIRIIGEGKLISRQVVKR